MENAGVALWLGFLWTTFVGLAVVWGGCTKRKHDGSDEVSGTGKEGRKQGDG